MNEYLLSVIGTVLLSAVLTAITPEGRTSGAIKGITKLVCVLAIIAPIANFFRSGEMLDEKNSSLNFNETGIQVDGEFIKYYSEKQVTQTQAALEREIFDKFSVQTSVTLVCERILYKQGLYDEEAVQVRQINVVCEKECAEEVKQKMWVYLTENYCSEVLIE